MSGLRRATTIAALALAALAAPVSAQAATQIVDLGPSVSPSGATCNAYTFKVQTSATDPTTHSVWGELCHRGKLNQNMPVQVLIHGGGYNHTYWDSPFKPATYSYVGAATNRGYATLNFDRYGYGRSEHPNPLTLDFNIAGYVTHQLVQALKGGQLGPAFKRVILNGHSMGAMAAENEAANFRDADGVILTGIGHNIKPPIATGATFYPADVDPKFIGKLPPGYLTTQPGKRMDAFVSPGTYDPAIVPYEEGIEKDTLSPTELTSLTTDTNDGSVTLKIRAPVLYAQGRYDTLWCGRTNDCTTDPQSAKESTYYSPGVSFTREVIPDAGHSINSSITAPVFYQDTFDWLKQQHLAP